MIDNGQHDAAYRSAAMSQNDPRHLHITEEKIQLHFQRKMVKTSYCYHRHFGGPGKATSQLCVCLSLDPTTTFE